jgi:hypothetical protein
MRLLGYLIPSSHYVLLALLFFAGLETVFALRRWLIPLSAMLLGVMVIGILLVRIEERGRFRAIQAVLPVLAVVGLTLFSLFLPTTILIHIYFVISSLILFWLLRHGAKLAYPTWNWTLSTVVLFLDAATILGLRFHLEYAVPLMMALGLIFLVAFLISFQAIRRVADLASDAVLIALATAISLTEIAWVLQFLPLHYVVQAGTLVVCYYVFFHLISVSYERRLQRKDITEYALVGVGALALILLTARWK